MKTENEKTYVAISPKDGAIKKISNKKFTEKGLFVERLTEKEVEELYSYYNLFIDCDVFFDEFSQSESRLTIKPLFN